MINSVNETGGNRDLVIANKNHSELNGDEDAFSSDSNKKQKIPLSRSADQVETAMQSRQTQLISYLRNVAV